MNCRAKANRSVVSLVCAAGVLLSAISWVVWRGLVQSNGAKHPQVLHGLPTRVPGWRVTDMPIATSEEMKKAVADMLNYDDAIYREYRNGIRSFTIYAAYWRSHKIHPRLIALHTPDVCWVANGWLMTLPKATYNIASRDYVLMPAQFRDFTMGNVAEHVLYWHVVDGRASRYIEHAKSESQSLWRRLATEMVEETGEQFFIRLSSEQSWDSWSDEPTFRSVIKAISPVLSPK